MGSKERIQRLKDENRINILDAALQIVKEEGWQALSMRKIADIIEYTAPMIYEYFPSKEAILSELSAQGYRQLAKKMREAKMHQQQPEKQLEAMWLAYWDFAFEHKERYQLMFGVGMRACEVGANCECSKTHSELVNEVIYEIMKEKAPSTDVLCRKYYTFWSVIHGLISINLVNIGLEDEEEQQLLNQQILKDAIYGITRSLTD
ncbi:TetR/AcrR family transcriptional regulator [Parapedobacter koreensis]|uniref:Transcriptional regulator, TetR family n=1 Tax=Parapedobacter koreensis TaxID=332977 RepID=A0A1H7FHZ7_9SPHI|nr:TetR/AcrR family transcriptional regulator [Parapedobacter koreensis]SEK22915.1 transcriptional regulator, TetR family [Parapedobacter koreensis]